MALPVPLGRSNCTLRPGGLMAQHLLCPGGVLVDGCCAWKDGEKTGENIFGRFPREEPDKEPPLHSAPHTNKTRLWNKATIFHTAVFGRQVVFPPRSVVDGKQLCWGRRDAYQVEEKPRRRSSSDAPRLRAREEAWQVRTAWLSDKSTNILREIILRRSRTLPLERMNLVEALNGGGGGGGGGGEDRGEMVEETIRGRTRHRTRAVVWTIANEPACGKYGAGED
ncbi:hypothetical protein QBC34DRAFT_491236 [Podospora aff. communis PSN243]|uniref:Uncharacterized protein n=1 Tax=Podospora aff. communis PSN243 TaxID=3040156 RepID=A0AAV9GZD3_9PEZI|nr:hypothetical protein QBC34DRAFT_491236 [Podospora aff. communis PSN243]